MHPTYPRHAAVAAVTLAAAVTAFNAHAQTPAPQRSLAYISEPGDPIGQGRSATAMPRFDYARADAIYMSAFDGTTGYNLSLVPADGQRLQVGRYEDARGGTQTVPGLPVLEFTSDTACEGSTGRFEITRLVFDEAGQVVSLRANFEQRCTGAAGALWGDVALDAGLASYTTRLERRGTHDGNQAQAYMIVQCTTATFGELRVRATQRARGGATTRAESSGTFGCRPEPTRVSLDLFADSTATWRNGPATLEVESYVNDPHYDEAGRVLRDTLQGTVLLHSQD